MRCKALVQTLRHAREGAMLIGIIALRTSEKAMGYAQNQSDDSQSGRRGKELYWLARTIRE